MNLAIGNPIEVLSIRVKLRLKRGGEFIGYAGLFPALHRVQKDRPAPVGIPEGKRQPSAVGGPGGRHESPAAQVFIEKNQFCDFGFDFDEVVPGSLVCITEFRAVR